MPKWAKSINQNFNSFFFTDKPEILPKIKTRGHEPSTDWRKLTKNGQKHHFVTPSKILFIKNLTKQPKKNSRYNSTKNDSEFSQVSYQVTSNSDVSVKKKKNIIFSKMVNIANWSND